MVFGNAADASFFLTGHEHDGFKHVQKRPQCVKNFSRPEIREEIFQYHACKHTSFAADTGIFSVLFLSGVLPPEHLVV
jgi:hypothetical protein